MMLSRLIVVDPGDRALGGEGWPGEPPRLGRVVAELDLKRKSHTSPTPEERVGLEAAS